IVRGADGKCTFANAQKRAAATDPTKIKILMHSLRAEFWMFDVLTLNDEVVVNKTYDERHKLLIDTVKPKYARILVPMQEKLAKTIEVVEKGEFANNEYTKHLEGLILKKRSSVYNNVRNEDWLKWKAVKTADCIIIGYTQGEGER